MKTFFNEHPFMGLIIVMTVCETAITLARIIKGNPTKITIGVQEKEEKSEDVKES